jgi:hypothetical protein
MAPHVEDVEDAAASDSQRARRGALAYCVTVFVTVRIALFLLGLLVPSTLPLQAPIDVPGWEHPEPGAGWHQAVVAWERADSAWFLRIASQGYSIDDGSPAFFPLFPLLVHYAGVVLGGRWLLAGFVVANSALLAAMYLLYRLTEHEYSTAMARHAVLFLAVFPTAFYLYSPFSEPLFLLAVVGALWLARQRRWVLAGLVGAAAAATRSVGIAMCAVLATEALWAARERRKAGERIVPAHVAGALAASALPALGTLAYLGYWRLHAGDWTVPFNAQGGWLRTFSWPWRTLAKGADMGTTGLGDNPWGYWTIDLLFVAFAVVAGVWLVRRARPAYAVDVWLSLLFPLFLPFADRPFMSLPRFIVTMFPLFWALAALAERRGAQPAIVGISAGGLVLIATLSIMYLPMF